jgi:hypothetical protein
MAGRGNPVTLKVPTLTKGPLKVRCASNRYYAVVRRVIGHPEGKIRVELRSDDPNTVATFVRRGVLTCFVFDLETGSLIWSGLPSGHIRLLPLLNRWHQAKGR